MLQKGDYEEKRDFTRMGLECPATYRIDGDPTQYQATATDLSAIGLQLNGDDAVKVGVEMMIEMTPEQAIVPPLMARAEVVRCNEIEDGRYQLGLKILEMLPGL